MKYLVINQSYIRELNGESQGLKLHDALEIIKNHNITHLLVIALTELIYLPESETISKVQSKLGKPITVLQFKSSYQSSDYDVITTDWCSHTGFVWENRFSYSYTPDHIPYSHNPGYNYKSEDLKLLCMLGKVRYPNRVLFWDSLISDGNLDNVLHSYYELLPDTQAWHQREHSISELSYFLRSEPDAWCDLVNSLDFDLTSRVPSNDTRNLFYCGYPTHPDLYDRTCGSIIPETTSDRQNTLPFITEKTYRAIQNFHPFCVYGDPLSHDYLKTQGYETFNSEFGIESDAGEFMATITEPDRDDNNHFTIKSGDLRQRHLARKSLAKHIDTVTEYFIDNYPDNYLTIKAKCEHNRYQWLHNVTSEQQYLTDYFSDSELLDIETNQKITNICEFLYHYHHIYLTHPE